MAAHNKLIEVARENRCDRIGLLLSGNSPDYPLTWRLMQQGASARHIPMSADAGARNWPCLYFVDKGQRKRLSQIGNEWITEDNRVFVRDLGLSFDNAPRSVYRADRNNHQESFNQTTDLYFYPEKEDIVMRSTAIDPQIRISVFSELLEAHWGVLRVEINSPAETTIQLYYQTNTMPYFTEINSYKRVIHVGNNSVYFLLPVDILQHEMRLDPVSMKGKFALRSIEIRLL